MRWGSTRASVLCRRGRCCRRLAFAPGDDAGGLRGLAVGGRRAGAWLAFRSGGGVVPWPGVQSRVLPGLHQRPANNRRCNAGPATAPRRPDGGVRNHCAACIRPLRCRAGAEVLAEPLDRSVGGVVEGAGLAEEVVGAGQGVPVLDALQQVVGLAQAGQAVVAVPGDHAGRAAQLAQRADPARPGRAAADQGADHLGLLRHRAHRRGAAGAAGHQADRQAGEGRRWCSHFEHRADPGAEQRGVERVSGSRLSS